MCRALAAVFVVGLIASPAPAGWQTFRSLEGGFTVTFPETPAKNTGSFSTPVGQVWLTLLAVHAERGREYVVGWAVIPPAVAGAPIGDILDGAIDGAAKGTKSKVVSRTVTTYGGLALPAREAVFAAPDGRQCKYLVFLNGRKLYQVLVVGSKKYVTGAEARDFIKSFRLL